MTKAGRVARRIAGVALLAFVLVFGFGRNSMVNLLDNALGENLGGVLRVLVRLWFFATVGGFFIGVIIAWLICRASWLAQATVSFLRLARWAPFLMWSSLAFLWIGATSPYWFRIYGAITVALTVCYEVLLTKSTLKLGNKASLRQAGEAALMQGMLIALFLDLSAWPEVWLGAWLGEVLIGHKVFILLVIAVLSINWAFGKTFESAATIRASGLLKELRCDTWKSSLISAAIIIAAVVVWEAVNRIFFLKSAAARFQFLYVTDFRRDITVSLWAVSEGLVLAGGMAALLLAKINALPRWVRNVLDVLFRATHIAPMALLPAVPIVLITIGSRPSALWILWSPLCVAVFSFYPFARAFYGLGNEPMGRRILLGLDESLPYAGAGIIYGGAMFATGGLGFAMTIAAASFDTFTGLVAFAALLLLVATLSTLLRWFAKRGLSPTPQEQALTPPSSAAA